jgi:hypothetical protein
MRAALFTIIGGFEKFMAAASELKRSLAADVQKLTGEARGLSLSDFPVNDSEKFLNYSLSGAKMCFQVVQDSVPDRSADLHEQQSCVCIRDPIRISSVVRDLM